MTSEVRAGMLATVAMLASSAAASQPMTAEGAMRAHARATSIGRDPCRPGVGDDEIVVCGRRDSPYALPLYEPAIAGDGLASGMAREIAVGTAQEASASCHARGEACTKPLVVISVPVGRGKKRGVVVGED